MHINLIHSRQLIATLIIVGTFAVLTACSGGSGSEPSPTPVPTHDPEVTPGPGVTEDEIALGMTNDLSGEGGTPYAAVTTAVEAYFASVNEEQEGVCGRALVLNAVDDEYTPQIALEATQALVLGEEVLAMIGGQSTDIHLPVARYLNDPDSDRGTLDGVPDLFVSTGWSGWGDVEQFPWTFGFIPDYASDGEVIATYVNREHEGESVAILYEDTNFGKDYNASVRQTLEDESLLVASVPYALPESVEPTEEDAESTEEPVVDVAPLVDQLIEAQAEIVILATTPDVTADVYLDAAVKDFAPQFLLSYVNTPSALAAEIGGGTSADDLLSGFEMLSGTVTTEYLLNLVEDEGAPALVEHQRIMETYDGPSVTTLSIYGQALAETVVETLARSCDELTRDGVRDSAETLSDFAPSLLLPGIEIDLGPEDHRAIETLQPVRIEEDGALTQLGSPIRAED